MNQILDYNNNNNSYNNNGNKKNNDGTDVVVRVFAILIMIFAIILVSVVGYGMYSNNTKEENSVQNESNASINVDIDGNKAIIEVSNDVKNSKLIYSWNEGSERTITCDEKYVKETIDVPAGTNSLYIKVIDENGAEKSFSESVSAEEGIDILDPVIELSITDEKKLKIVAKDETALDFITIRWNEDDEEKIYADEGSKEVSTEIDILKGENDLTIVAVDTSNNTTRENKSFKGLTKPEIKVELVDDGKKINIKAMHENGIKSVKLNFNNEDYDVDIGNDNPTQIEFEQPLSIGYNRVILKVKSVDDTETVFDGECNYGDITSNSRTDSEDADSDENVDNEDNEDNEDNDEEDSEEI